MSIIQAVTDAHKIRINYALMPVPPVRSIVGLPIGSHLTMPIVRIAPMSSVPSDLLTLVFLLSMTIPP